MKGFNIILFNNSYTNIIIQLSKSSCSSAFPENEMNNYENACSVMIATIRNTSTFSVESIIKTFSLS